MDYYGSRKTNIEHLNFQKIIVILFTAFAVYLVMLSCGTLGAPKSVQHIATTVHQLHQVEGSGNHGLQVCQQATSTEHPGEMVSLSLEINNTLDVTHVWQIRARVQVVDSENTSFMRECQATYMTNPHLSGFDLITSYN